VTAADLISLLDAAGIRRALVLSVAYQFGNPNRPAVEDEYAKVRAENDWTSQQVALYPDRLRGFCGFNPLRDYALQEMARCAKDPNLRFGIKLHFGNSDVQLENPEHLARVRSVFREANRRRMAIVVHMHSSVTRNRPFGARQARIFLDQLLSETRRVPVQIAHLTSYGTYDEGADQAMGVFVDAINQHDRRMANVYFDVSGLGDIGKSKEQTDRIARRIRQIGAGRVLFGSDGAVLGNSPADYLRRFRTMPLTDAEFRSIESNIAPYLR
jgi:predicted TIM-barrel fold metal-dependent hydrolase